jgi:hypothetical protein
MGVGLLKHQLEDADTLVMYIWSETNTTTTKMDLNM